MLYSLWMHLSGWDDSDQWIPGLADGPEIRHQTSTRLVRCGLHHQQPLGPRGQALHSDLRQVPLGTDSPKPWWGDNFAMGSSRFMKDERDSKSFLESVEILIRVLNYVYRVMQIYHSFYNMPRFYISVCICILSLHLHVQLLYIYIISHDVVLC